MRMAAAVVRIAAAVVALSSCSQGRYEPGAATVFDTDIEPVLAGRCAPCHGGATPAAGWNVASYLSTISCVQPDGAPATLPPDAAPILTALDVSPHPGLLSDAQRATLASWVNAGAPAFQPDVHDPGITDPRSPGFHGTVLRSQRWSAMLDSNDPGACGRCHDGVPAVVTGVTLPAPGATACTSCHTEPGGPLACSTCHGSGDRIYPPRDPCFFPADAATAGAHAAHATPSTESAKGLACSMCHPTPGTEVIGGLHGNGSVDVIFDTTLVSPEASYDRAARACAVSCHDRGGLRPRPSWDDKTPMGCNDCHSSPPAGHYRGPCTNCHAEANADGTALSGGPLHMNGKVDLGDGSGKCGACHGSGDSPWPTTAAHPAHESPSLTEPLACSSCHVVPTEILDPVHLDGTVQVVFSGLATAREAIPAWDGKQCTNVACHGANLADLAARPAWNDTSGAQAKCGACHGIPPTEHTASTSCNRSDCHGAEVTLDVSGAPLISDGGKALHIDGIIESAR
jgi:predicted CxxxxCH...CXXCH cytochrome family protein